MPKTDLKDIRLEFAEWNTGGRDYGYGLLIAHADGHASGGYDLAPGDAGITVLIKHGDYEENDEGETISNRAADRARRVVACWNACAGIETEALTPLNPNQGATRQAAIKAGWKGLHVADDGQLWGYAPRETEDVLSNVTAVMALGASAAVPDLLAAALPIAAAWDSVLADAPEGVDFADFEDSDFTLTLTAGQWGALRAAVAKAKEESANA